MREGQRVRRDVDELPLRTSKRGEKISRRQTVERQVLLPVVVVIEFEFFRQFGGVEDAP